MLLNFWVAGSAICHENLKVFNQRYPRWSAHGMQVVTVNFDDPMDAEKLRALARDGHLTVTILQGSDDLAGIYNILYRYLFDRHRDLESSDFVFDRREWGHGQDLSGIGESGTR